MTPEQHHIAKLRALTDNPQYDCPKWNRAYSFELAWLLEFWSKEAKE